MATNEIDEPHMPSRNEQSSSESSRSRRSPPKKPPHKPRVSLGNHLPPLTRRDGKSNLLSEIQEAAGSVVASFLGTDEYVPSRSSRATTIYASKVFKLPPLTPRDRKSKLLSEIQEAAGSVPSFDDTDAWASSSRPICASRVLKGGGRSSGTRRRSHAAPTPKDSTVITSSTRPPGRGNASERRRKSLPDANMRPYSEHFQREDLMEEMDAFSPGSERRLDKNNLDSFN
jgi:hypothetical protein